MSLVTQINSVLTRIGTEFKAIRVVTGDLANLDTTDKDSLVDAINEALTTGGGATNLAATLSATQTVITSDTGTDATIPAADTTNAGVMTKAMFDKLAGIEAAADVTDAGNIASSINGATAKTTPVGADLFGLIDTEASNALKKITLTNVAAFVTAIIVDSAPGTLDTLNEIAAALGDDPNFVTTINTALGNRVRTDVNNQGLNGTQQQNARINILVYSQAEIGDPATDFVAVFEAALV